MKIKSKKNIITFLILFLIIFLTYVLYYIYFFKHNYSDKSNNNVTKPQNIEKLNLLKSETIEYSGWIPTWREKDAIKTLENIDNTKLSQILPVWYSLNSEGELVENSSEYKTNIIDIAKNKKIEIMPTVNNVGINGFDPKRVSKMLSSREDFINRITDEIKNNGFSGVDLDFEEIDKNDKDKYSDFVLMLRNSLNRNNIILSVTLHAQDGKNQWIGYKGQDLKKLGENADYIRIMAYDFNNINTSAGPITPSSNLKDVIEYTLKFVDPKKIIICLPTYGYKWTEKGAIPLQYVDAQKVVAENKINGKREETSGEIYAKYDNYGDSFVLWYQDSLSMRTKVDLVKKYNINKICFWHIGGEDFSFWNF